jgi:HTH-type transcriptional regulator/antitoxin HigA
MNDFRPIHSEADYDAMLAEVEGCFLNEPKRGTADGDLFDILLALIGAYEREHWRIEAPHRWRHSAGSPD